MNKRLTIMGIILLVVFGGIIAFNLIKAYMIKQFFASYAPPAVSVSSAVAQEVDWKPTIDAVGNFVAINGVDVNSEASGNVVQIHFESGQYVEKDAPLITIDDSIDQALLKFNQSELTLKELSYKRQTDLFKRGATPSSSVDEAKANLQQAQAKVEQIQAQIKQKHIGAPFSGRLGIRQVNLGQYVSPGQTSIVSLQSLDPLYLEFYLPEQYYKRIHLNQPVTFRVEEFPNILFEGVIHAVNSKVDLTTHNVQVQALLPNCPADAIQDPTKSPLVKARKQVRGDKLIVACSTELNKQNKIRNFVFIPGMFASIEVDQPAEPNTIIVPSTAISYSLYGNAVYIIEKSKEGKKNKDGTDQLVVNRVFVTTGEQQGNYTVIKKGIKAGQLVVSTGDLKLQNGTPVVINNSVKLDTDSDPNQLGQ
ncbi:TPA: efflux RND transporter periplasmic adaptor subunit [Legionella pneumophila]|uniref:efflux RND transporter periplasmic adaptor subunit n=1 Tax=Legionella pneumophila TaxID=446 RepID=UPI00048A79AA|nr:efflux RND transporter periplasmic adaptor subunit [Legionella pneumophila]RYB35920.1 efflux RND transporter periplasmic adaptor subunit [Legionella pneumophila]RYW26034.1 efflux RND transporter periplasmic adaptor subunit [Legionella pneumophila]HAT1821973.1 efflux RND transporter periplasmic adaptor subunit [Legionella pneumophila]HAT1847181.1 efflux RND transporter periplasmic adaptor subunit [Legionella pneumophila]HAT1862524.1 efflux RND transporter periplasmic adaptor subunit [Legione